MSGDADYQLRVPVESLAAFEDFLRFKLAKIKGIAQVTTSFALRPVVKKQRCRSIPARYKRRPGS
ncbi:Lrp/AsnC ligand binding domain-containing protein [Sphingobium fluviale]|uniref:Lrp/AsnC ligand binding domain-containing protein n=1 Tax=Sphingobium fluviale TaxID=2506423 RepID=UPI001FE6697E|nr:Lrp/AsnC ligand binding domain-containing protein [Sphingobium fluviale]